MNREPLLKHLVFCLLQAFREKNCARGAECMTAGLVAAMLGAKVMFARAPDFVSRYALHIAG